MGHAEGGQTLEYELKYARVLNGLHGGITPAMIWKTYMERVLGGEPIEQFEGVDMPKRERTVSDTESPDAVNPRATEQPVPDGAANFSPPIDGNINVDPSSVNPSSVSPSRNAATRALR